MNKTRESIYLLIVIISSMLFTACTPRAVTPIVPSPSQAVSEPMVINAFEDARAIFKEIRNAPAGEAQKRADELWQMLVDSKRVPLVFGTQVIFLYKGEAEQVSWSGSFNLGNNPGLAGVRVGATDLWIAYTEFPAASRAEYKILLNGKDLIVDPVNSSTSYSGITGVTNVVTLPGFTVTDESKKRDDIRHGTLTGNLSIESTALGYTINYWVYTPVDYEELNQLPVIYVLDGNDFVDDRMGALPNILDNMIADGRTEPLLAVFIDAREPGNPQKNRREDEFLEHPIDYAQFIADELVPVIDRTYRTNPHPHARLITGMSYGGLSASFIAASRSDVFHNLAAFSPVYGVVYNPEFLADPKQAEGAQKMAPAINSATECGPATAFPCPRFPLKIFFSTGLPDWDVGDLSSSVSVLQDQGYAVEFHQVQEGHTWDHWRGLSDEMLIYFFGTD